MSLIPIRMLWIILAKIPMTNIIYIVRFFSSGYETHYETMQFSLSC